MPGEGEGRLSAMLPRSRVFSALLVGLGVALMVAGLLTPKLIHADPRIPLEPADVTLRLVDPEAKTRLLSDGRVLTSPVTRQIHVQLQDPASADNVTENVGVSLLRDSYQEDRDRLISATVWNLNLDRGSAEIREPLTVRDQLVGPSTSAPEALGALWMHFPLNPEKRAYPVLDDTLRAPVTAEFIGEEEHDGRQVMHYRQDIKAQNVHEHYQNFFTSTEIDGEELFLFHSGTRDLYVDAATGVIINIEEDIHDFYGTKDAKPREDVLKFRGELTEEAVAQRLAHAAELPKAETVKVWGWALLGIGAVLTLLALVGAFRGRA